MDKDNQVALRPSQDELSRQAFIVRFKQKVNLDLQGKIRSHFCDKIQPALEADLGVSLSDVDRKHRVAVKDRMSSEHIFHVWESLTWIGQTMMWDAVDEMIQHELPRIESISKSVMENKDPLGSLTLRPELHVPPNVSKIEIHRQPGGFCFERDGHPFDYIAGARMTGGGMVYGAGKGRTERPGYSAAQFLIEEIEKEFGERKPKRILDIGCGTGSNTQVYAEYYPDAHVVGIDVAPGLLRWGHMRCEQKSISVHFEQMNSADLHFDDQSFDLVVSNIWGHETTPSILSESISEIWRVLRPGGISCHMDVPNQPGYTGLVDQFLNDWQIKYNGEAFWMGWADTDLFQVMTKAGYPEDCQFAEYRKRTEGVGHWFVHGAIKPS